MEKPRPSEEEVAGLNEDSKNRDDLRPAAAQTAEEFQRRFEQQQAEVQRQREILQSRAGQDRKKKKRKKSRGRQFGK